MKDVGPLVRELVDVRITGSGLGKVRIGADGSGQHDDLDCAGTGLLEDATETERIRYAASSGD